MVNTLLLPERAREVLPNSSCVATLVEHGVFIISHFFLYLLEEKKSNAEMWRVHVGEVTGAQENDQLR